jgi:hypothetical protein
MPSVQNVVDKWVRNTTSAASSYREAIQALNVNPLERAADRADLWQQRIQDPRTKDKFIAGLRRQSFDDWRRKTAEIGSTRLSQGVQAAAPKMRAFMEAFLPIAQQVKERVRQMPKGSTADALARVEAVITAFQDWARSRR